MEEIENEEQTIRKGIKELKALNVKVLFDDFSWVSDEEIDNGDYNKFFLVVDISNDIIKNHLSDEDILLLKFAHHIDILPKKGKNQTTIALNGEYISEESISAFLALLFKSYSYKIETL